MKKNKILSYFLISYLILTPALFIVRGQGFSFTSSTIQLGNEVLIESYLDSLNGKRIALLINHTSIVPSLKKPLLNILLEHNLQIVKIFAPEHGIHGELDAGENFSDQDETTSGIPVVNLYRYQDRIPDSIFRGIDLILYDIQDVGTRFYTYISLLCSVIQSASVHDVEVWVLDRPNPNIQFCDGPVLDTTYRSYVGLHPVPIVYGLTVGEYVLMAKAKGWLNSAAKVRVIAMKNFRRNEPWETLGLPWIPPSPNLKTVLAAKLYPAFGWFEGTLCSVGRGTETPFQLYGVPYLYPEWKDTTFYGFRFMATLFTPTSKKGAKNPKYKNMPCYGYMVIPPDTGFSSRSLFLASLSLLKLFYNSMRNTDKSFFNSYFERLAGVSWIKKDLESGKEAEEIYRKWLVETESFCIERKQYFLYPEE